MPSVEASETHKRAPAPGELATVQSFVNSAELDEDRDELDSPAKAHAWFVAQALLDSRVQFDDAEAMWAVEVREALRDVLEGNAGRDVRPAAIEVLNDAAAAARFPLRFDASAEAQPQRPARSLADALGAVLLIVARAQASGTWTRLKVCPADNCRWAFYDRSRNRSGTWCSMSVCGAREKMRRYRDRRAATPGAPTPAAPATGTREGWTGTQV